MIQTNVNLFVVDIKQYNSATFNTKKSHPFEMTFTKPFFMLRKNFRPTIGLSRSVTC